MSGHPQPLRAEVGRGFRMTRLTLPLLQTSEAGAVVYITSPIALATVLGFSAHTATNRRCKGGNT
jgi:hypothetical protein